MNIVLITNGLNPVSKGFAKLPAKPIGIINLHCGEKESNLMRFIRKAYKIISFKRYSTIEDYCAYYELRYAKIHKNDSQRLTQLLSRWSCNLLITSSCPVIPISVVENLSHGAINVHPSLLPAYRGGNPLFWQVFDQEKLVGTTIHYLNSGIDTGPIIEAASTNRPIEATKSDLSELLEGDLGLALLEKVITKIKQNTVEPVVQGATKSEKRYARNFELLDIRQHCDFQNISFDALWDLVHYFGTWPDAITNTTGWRKWVRWIPVERICFENGACKTLNGTLLFQGLDAWLHHSDGKIRLRPRLDVKYLLIRLIQ